MRVRIPPSPLIINQYLTTMKKEVTTKECKKCGRELPLANFSRNKSTKDGLDHYCKECRAKARKKRHPQPDKTVIREVADKVTDKLEHSAVEESKSLQDPNNILNAIKDVMKETLEIKEQRVKDMLDDTVQSLLGIAIQLSDARKTLKNVYYEELSKKRM